VRAVVVKQTLLSVLECSLASHHTTNAPHSLITIPETCNRPDSQNVISIYLHGFANDLVFALQVRNTEYMRSVIWKSTGMRHPPSSKDMVRTKVHELWKDRFSWDSLCNMTTRNEVETPKVNDQGMLSEGTCQNRVPAPFSLLKRYVFINVKDLKQLKTTAFRDIVPCWLNKVDQP
jgi:hypothetical protein